MDYIITMTVQFRLSMVNIRNAVGGIECMCDDLHMELGGVSQCSSKLYLRLRQWEPLPSARLPKPDIGIEAMSAFRLVSERRSIMAIITAAIMIPTTIMMIDRGTAIERAITMIAITARIAAIGKSGIIVGITDAIGRRDEQKP
jgi:hypothetical protein